MESKDPIFKNLYAPIQYIDNINGVEIWIKREDLIHPEISGNKWRKLKYHLQAFRKSDKTEILSFGGAFSNHIYALAAMGEKCGIKTKAIIRGEEVSNFTLSSCQEKGMELFKISRSEYKRREEPSYLRELAEKFPNAYIIPEGARGVLAMKGCTEIMENVDQQFDIICCSAGTGTTFSGLLMNSKNAKCLMFPALKGGEFLKDDIKSLMGNYQKQFLTEGDGKKIELANFSLEENYHFGGYGKVDEVLIKFMNDFHQSYGIPLDPIYTSKMLFGIMDKIKKKQIKPGTKVLCIHTGGLQGIRGMNERLQKKAWNTLNYEA